MTCQVAFGDGLATALVKDRLLGYRRFSRARPVTKIPMIQSIPKESIRMVKALR